MKLGRGGPARSRLVRGTPPAGLAEPLIGAALPKWNASGYLVAYYYLLVLTYNLQGWTNRRHLRG